MLRNIFLRYRGMFHEYAQLSLKEEMVGQIERSRHLHPETVSQSVQLLCDRGASTSFEVRLSNLRLTSLEVVHMPNNSTQSDISNWCAMHIRQMGS